MGGVVVDMARAASGGTLDYCIYGTGSLLFPRRHSGWFDEHYYYCLVSLATVDLGHFFGIDG